MIVFLENWFLLTDKAKKMTFKLGSSLATYNYQSRMKAQKIEICRFQITNYWSRMDAVEVQKIETWLLYLHGMKR